MIDIEEKENDRLAASEAVAERLVSAPTVGQAGERIAKRRHPQLASLHLEPLEHLAIASISKLHADAGLQLLDALGELHEVVRASKEAANGPLFRAVNRAHQDDRGEPEFVDEPKLAAELDSGHPLEVHVEEDEIGRGLVDAVDRFIGGRGEIDSVPVEAENPKK